MKICWDNLEKLIYRPDRGNWQKKWNYYEYKESCDVCGEPYLACIGEKRKSKGLFCSIRCAGKVKIFTEGHKRKISEAKNGVKQSEEVIKKRAVSLKGLKAGKNHHNWKGGYRIRGIPMYDTYAPQIEWCEKVRRDPKDKNILQVRCSYNGCEKWFRPKRRSVKMRILCLRDNSFGSSRFYCSEECKEKCSIYGKSVKTLMKEDAVRAGSEPWWKLTREVQPELRQMVFKRDGYQCVKCGTKKELHCHHVEGILWEPLESADVDMCITVCKNCHMEIHKKEGCKPSDMRCEEI